MEKKKEDNIKLNDKAVQITALSATALLVDFGNTISTSINEKVMALFSLLQQKELPWIIDLVPAYASLGIIYNLPFIKINEKPEGLVFNWVKKEIATYLSQIKPFENLNKNLVEIPICFDGFFPNDLLVISNKTNLTTDEIIKIFLGKTYQVFMLGFLPGFAYMGEVDKRISMPRKETAIPINAGAVGITGVQTGVYPSASPGGWHILGHTPLNMFNAKNNPPNLLIAGDTIAFKSITKEEYSTVKNEFIH